MLDARLQCLIQIEQQETFHDSLKRIPNFLSLSSGFCRVSANDIHISYSLNSTQGQVLRSTYAKQVGIRLVSREALITTQVRFITNRTKGQSTKTKLTSLHQLHIVRVIMLLHNEYTNDMYIFSFKSNLPHGENMFHIMTACVSIINTSALGVCGAYLSIVL